MTDQEKGLALIALLIWAMWRTEQTSVNLYQTCPDGSVIPLWETCPTVFLNTSSGENWVQCADSKYYPATMACDLWIGSPEGLTLAEVLQDSSFVVA